MTLSSRVRGGRWAVAVGVAAAAVLAAGALAVPELRADERRTAVAVQEREAAYRQAVVAAFTEVEAVVEPVLLASVSDAASGDEVRADVYQLGDAGRDLRDRRSRLDGLVPPSERWRPRHAALQRHLDEASAALSELAAVDAPPAEWQASVDVLTRAQAGWRAVLKDDVLLPGAQLPSAVDATRGPTRAASILRFDLVCDDARLTATPDRAPRTPAEAVRFVASLDQDLSRLGSGLLGVEVPAYERSFVETNVHLPAQRVLDRVGPVSARLAAAIASGDREAVLRDVRGPLAAIEADLALVAEALDAYGATVCGRYLGVDSPSGVEPEGTTA